MGRHNIIKIFAVESEFIELDFEGLILTDLIITFDNGVSYIVDYGDGTKIYATGTGASQAFSHTYLATPNTIKISKNLDSFKGLDLNEQLFTEVRFLESNTNLERIAINSIVGLSDILNFETLNNLISANLRALPNLIKSFGDISGMVNITQVLDNFGGSMVDYVLAFTEGNISFDVFPVNTEVLSLKNKLLPSINLSNLSNLHNVTLSGNSISNFDFTDNDIVTVNGDDNTVNCTVNLLNNSNLDTITFDASHLIEITFPITTTVRDVNIRANTGLITLTNFEIQSSIEKCTLRSNPSLIGNFDFSAFVLITEITNNVNLPGTGDLVFKDSANLRILKYPPNLIKVVIVNIPVISVDLSDVIAAINYVDYLGCALDAASITSVLTVCDANGASNGYLDISGGTNTAPSGGDLTLITSLQGKGWTVINN